MKTLSYTSRQFERLKKFKLEKGISNIESELYIAKVKENFEYKDYIIKKLYLANADSLANKFFTVIMLGDYGADLNIPALVLPEHQVLIDNKISGFTTPPILGRNFGLLIEDFHTSDELTIDLFKKIGEVIRDVHNNSGYVFPGGLKLNICDLHPYNIIIDKEGNPHFVDLDSATLGSRLPNPSMYLATTNYLLQNTNKYPVVKMVSCNLNVPNDNTDLYCYNMMILEYIAKYKVRKLSIDDYYGYLSYLSDLGYGSDILESFMRLPISSNNINPCDVLDGIPLDMVARSSYKVYKYLKDKKVG